MINKALVITGFHRSATSATANYLNDAGLYLGHDLMKGNISNIRGHFEDWPAVTLHDEQLFEAGTSWQFHEEVALQPDSQFLSKYIHQRWRGQQFWGVKDPRACLFLDQWQQELGQKGSFLLITRHWSSCIESLLHRHSRDLAYSLSRCDVDSQWFKFWTSPDIAAKMWLSYSKRMLSFTKRHPSQVLLCTQRALFEGAPLITKVNQKFGFELDDTIECPYDKSLLNDSASDLIKNSLSQSLIFELEKTWSDLINISDFNSLNEEPIYYSMPLIPKNVENDYLSAIKSFKVECDLLIGEKIKKDKAPTVINVNEFFNLTKSEFNKWLHKLRLIDLTPENFVDIACFISKKYPLSTSLWIALGKLQQKNCYYESAINTYQKAISLGNAPPYVNMNLAMCYQGMGMNKLALYFFDKALRYNPDNHVFYGNKTKLYLSIGKIDLAEICIKHGIERLGFLPEFVVLYSTILQIGRRNQEALSVLEKSERSCPIVDEEMANVRAKINTKQGLIDYNKLFSKQLEGKDRLAWLVESTGSIYNSLSERDFITRCIFHWDKLDKSI